MNITDYLQVMKEELTDECDYTREASFLRSFGSASHLGNDPRFKVPWVWEKSTNNILVMERVHGTSVGDADLSGLSQTDRNDVGLTTPTSYLRALSITLPAFSLSDCGMAIGTNP